MAAHPHAGLQRDGVLTMPIVYRMEWPDGTGLYVGTYYASSHCSEVVCTTTCPGPGRPAEIWCPVEYHHIFPNKFAFLSEDQLVAWVSAFVEQDWEAIREHGARVVRYHVTGDLAYTRKQCVFNPKCAEKLPDPIPLITYKPS